MKGSIGQEVLVRFLEGDIDRPIVVGTVYNGQGEAGTPPTPNGLSLKTSDPSVYTQAADRRPSAQGNAVAGASPAWHGASPDAQGHRNPAALSGLKSAEFGSGSGQAQGYNQLVLDDTDQQLRVQLASTQGATQLNLGHLIHQADNARGSLRGLGIELRTDAQGAIRAHQGVLLTSYAPTTAYGMPTLAGPSACQRSKRKMMGSRPTAIRPVCVAATWKDSTYTSVRFAALEWK